MDLLTNDSEDLLTSILSKTKPKATEKKKANSNFHFVINTNISHYAITQATPEHRQALIKTITATSREFKDTINAYIKDNKGRLNLTACSMNLEIGPQKKFLHIDGFLRFDGYCLMDTTKMANLFNSKLKPTFSKGVYVNVKYVHDSIAATIDYTTKDSMAIL